MTHSPNPQRRLGLGMLAVAWLLGLALLTGLFQNRLDHQHNPNRAPDIHRDAQGSLQVRLVPNRLHHYLAGATINGRPVTLLIDTGASSVVIPARIAASMNLPDLGRGHAITANGRTRVIHTRLDELAIGPIVLHDIPAAIAEGYEADEILFGMSALRHLHFYSDGGVLVLEPL